MARGKVRGAARTTYTLADIAIWWIAMVLISGLISAGIVRGQDLVPAPPDFKPAVSPVIITPPGPVESQAQTPPAASSQSDLGAAIRQRFGVPTTPLFYGESAPRPVDTSLVAEGLERARAKAKERKYVDVLHEVELVLSEDPTNSEALLKRVVCRIVLWRPLDDEFLDLELHVVDRLLKKEPSNGAWRAYRGVLLNCKGDPRRASELTYAVEHGETYPDWYYHRGLRECNWRSTGGHQ